MIHELKIWPEFFEQLLLGNKPFEIREVRDRNFEEWDILRLQEFAPDLDRYTGREVMKVVSYITDFAQRPGFIVMGLRDIK